MKQKLVLWSSLDINKYEENQSCLEKEAEMADQWEMCETGTGYVIIYTPKGVEGLKYKEFIQRHKDHVIERNDQSEVVCLLLFDGWEPYTADSGNKLFRRKYQS